MNKLLIALTTALLLTACASSATPQDDEYELTTGFYKSVSLGYIVQDSTNNLIIRIATSRDGEIFPVFLQWDSKCKRFSNKSNSAKSSIIAGKRVKMTSQCMQENYKSFYPKTAKGQKYFIEILENDNMITVDDWEFKTNGYNHFSEIVLDAESGM